MDRTPQTIAVVDDDRSMRQAVARLLLAAGFNARTFPEGESFLGAAAEERADCLVLDMHLPGLSGLEVRQRLSESQPSLPVIFITAHEEPELREQALRSGCVAFLRKPFPGGSLLAAVSRALRGPE